MADNGSTDGTPDNVRTHHPAVTLLTPGANLGAVGRNLGVAAVDTPYVAFRDHDTSYDSGGRSLAAEVLDRHPTLAAVTGYILVEPESRDDPICDELRASPLATPAVGPLGRRNRPCSSAPAQISLAH